MRAISPRTCLTLPQRNLTDRTQRWSSSPWSIAKNCCRSMLWLRSCCSSAKCFGLESGIGDAALSLLRIADLVISLAKCASCSPARTMSIREAAFRTAAGVETCLARGFGGGSVGFSAPCAPYHFAGLQYSFSGECTKTRALAGCCPMYCARNRRRPRGTTSSRASLRWQSRRSSSSWIASSKLSTPVGTRVCSSLRPMRGGGMPFGSRCCERRSPQRSITAAGGTAPASPRSSNSSEAKAGRCVGRTTDLMQTSERTQGLWPIAMISMPRP
mmetsp:Transcript_112156/g.317282  ORF Transcript_112156/g.317282 Transcript_112156/m.317282 type:complete len:272 (+) Transcript_112156:338-1153(+)